MSPVLGYWKIRGLAQAIRLLLEYTGEEYKEKLYESGNAPDYSRDDWLQDKFKLGLDFPNLPYWIEGDLKLTQSQTILRYIAEKHDMVGKTVAERAIINMLGDEVQDFRMGFARTCYNPNFEEIKNDYLKQLPDSLKHFSLYLGEKKWLVGDKVV